MRFMPDPSKYKDKQKWMEDCMHQTKTEEGKPQDQAVAICLSMWRNKGKDKDKAAALNNLAKSLDKIADSVQEKGFDKDAMSIDEVSNTLEKMSKNI